MTSRKFSALIPAAVALLLTAAPLRGAAFSKPLATRTVLPSGIVLLHSEQRALPIVTVRITFRAGAAVEPAEKAGLANLTATLLREGTQERTATELSEAIDALGGRIGFDANRDTSSGGITVLRSDVEEGMRLLAEMILRPSFPEKELQRAVKETIGRIERSKQNPASEARAAFRKALYGSHPYGRRVAGAVKTLRSIQREDLVRFHRDFYRPGGAIVAVVGDVSLQEAKGLLERVFPGWSGSPPPAPPHPEPKFPGSLKVSKIQRQVAQARILFGHPGIRRDNPDYYAVRVMNYILGGGGFESRILKTIREEQGLAYSAWSYFRHGLQGGSFQAGLGTRNETANRALDALFQEIRRIREKPVTERELADAKAFLTGSFALRLSGNRNTASFLTTVEMYGLGLDYVEKFPRLISAVTVADVLRVARKYLRPEDGVLLILADDEKAKLRY
ncbi:MAG: M16 family metallopeptidase [Nitrospinota bacterium]